MYTVHRNCETWADHVHLDPVTSFTTTDDDDDDDDDVDDDSNK